MTLAALGLHKTAVQVDLDPIRRGQTVIEWIADNRSGLFVGARDAGKRTGHRRPDHYGHGERYRHGSSGARSRGHRYFQGVQRFDVHDAGLHEHQDGEWFR